MPQWSFTFLLTPLSPQGSGIPMWFVSVIHVDWLAAFCALMECIQEGLVYTRFLKEILLLSQPFLHSQLTARPLIIFAEDGSVSSFAGAELSIPATLEAIAISYSYSLVMRMSLPS